jgi:hypothetical protein
MDWSLDNLTQDESKRVADGLGPNGQFFLIIVPRLIEEPRPKPEPYTPNDTIPENPYWAVRCPYLHLRK